jgi:chaperonin GroES
MAKNLSKPAVNNLHPMPGYVLVEPADVQTKTDTGIYLPDSHEEKPQQGEVLAIGDTWITENGAKIECPVKVGNQVIYKKWGGNDFKLGTKEFQFLKFEDILAIVK